MARPKGSKNKPKEQEVLYTTSCKVCGWFATTSIKNVQFGHVCNGKGK